MNDRIAVVCKNFEESKKALENILSEIKFIDIDEIISRNTLFIVYLKNGDIYYAVDKKRESLTRGNRYDFVFVSKDVDIDFLEKVIFRCATGKYKQYLHYLSEN